MALHVLLIDDDLDDADIFADAVRDLKPEAKVEHFINGIDALSSLAIRTDVDLQIIFLDINMPQISGWECLRYLKELAHLRKIPVVMYSTSCLTKEFIMAMDIGASALLTKHSNFTELKAELLSIFKKFLLF